MNELTRVYIFSRVSPNTSESVLHYQTDLLESFALEHDMDIVAINEQIGINARDNKYSFNDLIWSIKNERIDVVLIWSPHRIALNPGEYEEFEMFCHMNNVCILSLMDLKKKQFNC